MLQAFWQELRGRTRVTIDHPAGRAEAGGRRGGAVHLRYSRIPGQPSFWRCFLRRQTWQTAPDG
ncbi:hypothetical protein D8I24_4028 (plasmid) [Cupriavidus necator H850]|nr:hypothetical protein D8I24_4028 [Cupriavidus necator H850]